MILWLALRRLLPLLAVLSLALLPVAAPAAVAGMHAPTMARAERAAPHEHGHAMAQKDLAQKDLAQKDLAQKDLAQKDLAQKDLAQKDLAQKDLAQKDLAQKDLAQKDLAQKDLAQKDLAQKDLAQKDLAQKDLAQKDLAQKDNMAGAAMDAMPCCPPEAATPPDQQPGDGDGSTGCLKGCPLMALCLAGLASLPPSGVGLPVPFATGAPLFARKAARFASVTGTPPPEPPRA
ncbi:hypothetical protein [Methylobacterium sp. CM6246]